VGVYDFYPICHSRDRLHGRETTLFSEILDYMAAREGWDIRYHEASLSSLLEKIETEEIDLLLAAPYSEGGDVFRQYSRETVISTWGQIYCRRNEPVASILDLSGRSVGLLHDDPYNEKFRGLAASFELNCRMMEFKHYDQLFQALEEGWIEAALLDRISGFLYEKRFQVEKTPIVLFPIELRFAAAAGRGVNFISKIDYHVRELKDDSESVYHQFLENAFYSPPDSGIAEWIAWTMAAALFLAVAAGGASFVLKRQVAQKTGELKLANEALEKEAESRYQAMKALEGSNRLYEKTLSSMRDGLLVVDAQADQIIQANDAAALVLGLSLEALYRARPMDFYADADEVEAFYERVRRVSTEKGYFYDTMEMKGPGARIFPAEVTVTPLHPDGELSGQSWVVIFRDITARLRAESALLESEQQKQLILNSTAEMVAYLDPEFRVIWANRAAADLVGDQPENLRGRSCYGLWHRRSSPCPGCPALQVRTEPGRPRETEMQTPDGRCFSVRAYTVLDGEGSVIGMVEFGQEITDRKKAEAANARLQEQFQQAQKMESIGRLAGGVAHDLNNLLFPILGYGEILLEDAALTEAQKDTAKEIIGAGKRARDLVRQLLAFSRKQMLEFKPIDVNDLVTNLEKLLRRTLRENIAIHTRLARPLPYIEGDRGQLEQVLVNLAVNAQDAMPAGGELTVETGCAYLDESYAAAHEGVVAGEYVMLAVTDTGCGMEAETREHLFEPFYTTKSAGKGTGLGLATSYGIVKQHSGNIWVYSELHEGTTFKVYLPVYHPEGIPEPAPAPGLDAPVRPGTETILLAEDDPQVRKLALTMLKRQGYTVLVAEKGQAAIDLAAAHKGEIQLLVTDVIMPDMNGKQLYEKIFLLFPNVGVLYMSGYTDDVIARHGVIDEGLHFIEKPFHINALAAKVRGILDAEAGTHATR
jgi:PAS domain S-box-containing protein